MPSEPTSGLLLGGRLNGEMWQAPLGPARQPPVGRAEEVHGRRDEHGAQDEGLLRKILNYTPSTVRTSTTVVRPASHSRSIRRILASTVSTPIVSRTRAISQGRT